MKTAKFTPHPLLPKGYTQTLFAAVWPHLDPVEPSIVDWVQLGDGDQLRLDIHAPAEDDCERPLILLLHGTGGSGDDSLIVRQAQKFRRLGYTAIRFHHRGCGIGALERVTSLYHAGRLLDLLDTLHHLDRRWPGRLCLVVGYSLSGNMMLRLLGDGKSYALKNVKAVLAVCPPIELETASLALATPRNRPFDTFMTLRFVKQARTLEGKKPRTLRRDLPLIFRSRELDQEYNCRVAGYNTRSDYYDAYSAKSCLGRVTVPVTILTTADDPIVPVAMFKKGIPSNINLRIEERGGHVAFIGQTFNEFGDRRWIDSFVIDWVSAGS